MAFGEKLQEVRKQSGMTQETFAEQLHVICLLPVRLK